MLLATDFSSASNKALHYSLALARFYGARFCLAHVVSSLGLTMAGPGAIAACEDVVLREAAELEASLIRTRAFAGVEHKFIVRQGELWPQLREVIREESTDLLVIGTHGRRGITKLFFGSTAEHIFRQAHCPVLAFGPYADDRTSFVTSSRQPTILLAAGFAHGSLHGLPQAISVANQLGAKLAVLSIVPAKCSQAAEHRTERGPETRGKILERLSRVADDAGLDFRPEVYAESESGKPASEKILETADKLQADLIMIGFHHAACTEAISPPNMATTYEVVCEADSPVLTVSCHSGYELRPRPAEGAASLRSEADMIRSHGLGVKW